MSTMKNLVIRPADVSLNPLGASSSVADARVSVVYDRDVWVGGQPVPRVPIVETSIPTAGLRVPVLASDDPSITEGAGFVIKVVVETAPRIGQHNETGTRLARTIQVVTADPDEIPLGSKSNLTPVADPAQYADVYSIDRRTLNADLVLDPSSWDKNVVHALVLTQDATGNRKVTIAGESIVVDAAAKSETVLAAVWTGTKWMVRSSAASAVSVTPAPEWSARTTATTGSPTDTSVVVSFSQDIPVGTLQVRYGSTDSWRTVIKSGRNVTLSGLSPSTSYAAPEFHVVNASGESSVIAAQAFTTLPKAKSWTQGLLATFTAPDGTLIENYTPEKGGKFTRGNTNAAIKIVGGQTQVEYTGTNYAYQMLRWGTTNGDFNLRIRVKYSGIPSSKNSIVVEATAARNDGVDAGSTGIAINSSSISAPGVGTWTEKTGNTGGVPESGEFVMTFSGSAPDALTITLTSNGAKVREWTGSWAKNYGDPLYLSRVELGIGGGDILTDVPVSVTHVDEVEVGYWR